MSDDGIQVWAPMEVVEALLARAEKAESVIQRVLDVLDGSHPIPKVWSGDDVSGVGAYTAGCTDALRRVRRALDGAE